MSVHTPFPDPEQSCRCPGQRRTAKWPGFDFNMVAELCRCCGQVALKSGHRFSVWFCPDCKEQVGLLNGRLGRYAVPIGRHSVHGGFLLKPDGSGTIHPLEIHQFVARWHSICEAMDVVEAWAGEVVRRTLRDRFPTADANPLLTDYLEQCRADEAEKMRRFREMMDFLKAR